MVVVVVLVVVVVVVVGVVLVAQRLHINGHNLCTFSRRLNDKHSHNPTNVGHMPSSSQTPMVKVVVVVVQYFPPYGVAGRRNCDSEHVQVPAAVAVLNPLKEAMIPVMMSGV